MQYWWSWAKRSSRLPHGQLFFPYLLGLFPSRDILGPVVAKLHNDMLQGMAIYSKKATYDRFSFEDSNQF